MKRSRWLLPTLAYVFVVTVGAYAVWLVQENSDEQDRALAMEQETRERESCERANESRAVVRDIAVQVGVESAESIIEIAAAGDDPPDSQVIEAYRDATERRMNAIASQLEDRDCEAEARERARSDLAPG